MIPRWKGYWILRGVEAYLIRSGDTASQELVTALIDKLEKEMT